MAKGDRFPAEWRTFVDDQTGVEVRQLTAYKGHSPLSWPLLSSALLCQC